MEGADERQTEAQATLDLCFTLSHCQAREIVVIWL